MESAGAFEHIAEALRRLGKRSLFQRLHEVAARDPSDGAALLCFRPLRIRLGNRRKIPALLQFAQDLVHARLDYSPLLRIAAGGKENLAGVHAFRLRKFVFVIFKILGQVRFRHRDLFFIFALLAYRHRPGHALFTNTYPEIPQGLAGRLQFFRKLLRRIVHLLEFRKLLVDPFLIDLDARTKSFPQQQLCIDRLLERLPHQRIRLPLKGLRIRRRRLQLRQVRRNLHHEVALEDRFRVDRREYLVNQLRLADRHTRHHHRNNESLQDMHGWSILSVFGLEKRWKHFPAEQLRPGGNSPPSRCGRIAYSPGPRNRHAGPRNA